jgi:DNA-binding GntR family transcriptional regulator
MSVASPLVADLAKHLRSRILAGEYAPEAKVTESGLAAEYGVARPTVRSAIELLAGEGLLVRSPFAAVRVPAIPLSERDELVTVLRFTEDLALDRIRSQQPDVRELRQAASGSLHGMLATLVRVSGSPRLEPIHRRTTFELMLLTQQHPGELASPDDAAAMRRCGRLRTPSPRSGSPRPAPCSSSCRICAMGASGPGGAPRPPALDAEASPHCRAAASGQESGGPSVSDWGDQRGCVTNGPP